MNSCLLVSPQQKPVSECAREGVTFKSKSAEMCGFHFSGNCTSKACQEMCVSPPAADYTLKLFKDEFYSSAAWLHVRDDHHREIGLYLFNPNVTTPIRRNNYVHFKEANHTLSFPFYFFIAFKYVCIHLLPSVSAPSVSCCSQTCGLLIVTFTAIVL